MRRVALALSLIAAPLAAQQQPTFDLSVRNIMRGPELYGREPVQVRWTADGQWIYFRWLEPEDKSRAVKIDQIRQLLLLTSMTASFGLRKLVVISPAESMNGAAGNALLKSLEEPAKDTYLILVSQRIQGLPATVRSRCQKLRLGLPDERACLGWLDQLTGDHARSAA